jgi:hypothetical protein
MGGSGGRRRRWWRWRVFDDENVLFTSLVHSSSCCMQRYIPMFVIVLSSVDHSCWLSSHSFVHSFILSVHRSIDLLGCCVSSVRERKKARLKEKLRSHSCPPSFAISFKQISLKQIQPCRKIHHNHSYNKLSSLVSQPSPQHQKIHPH